MSLYDTYIYIYLHHKTAPVRPGVVGNCRANLVSNSDKSGSSKAINRFLPLLVPAGFQLSRLPPIRLSCSFGLAGLCRSGSCWFLTYLAHATSVILRLSQFLLVYASLANAQDPLRAIQPVPAGARSCRFVAYPTRAGLAFVSQPVCAGADSSFLLLGLNQFAWPATHTASC